MVDFKEKLRQLRKPEAADRSSSEASPPVEQQEKVSGMPPAARGSRFGGLTGREVGSFDDAQASVPPDDEDIPWFDDLPKTRPAPTQQAPARFGGLSTTQRQEPRPARIDNRRAPDRPQELEVAPIEWDDPSRPAGSSYSIEEWLAAEDGGKNVVFEMVKPDETGLCAIPAEAMNGVEAILYSRSLIVSEDVPDAARWPAHATIIHRDEVLGQRGAMRYRVVRSEDAIRANPVYNGSTLRNDLEVAFQEAKKAQAQRGRFGNMPR